MLVILQRTKYCEDLTILQCVGTATIKDSNAESANVIVTETSYLVTCRKQPCPAWASSWELMEQTMTSQYL